MINNQPYNLQNNQDKQFLGQSRIFNDSKSLSSHIGNRNDKQFMYSSGIFMKNSTIINSKAYQQNYQNQYNIPTSPHKLGYIKTPNIQFVNNTQQIYKPQNNLEFTINPLINQNNHNNMNYKESIYDKQIQDLQQKIDLLTKRVQINEKKQKLSQKNSIATLDDEDLFIEKKLYKDDYMREKDFIDELQKYKLHSEQQSVKIWKKLNKFDEIFTKLNLQNINKKLQQLQQSYQFTNSNLSERGYHPDEHLVNRIKCIEKSIREMGEDVHLVNDKQENLQVKFQTQIIQIKKLLNNQLSHNEVEVNKAILLEFKNKVIDLQNEVQLMRKQIRNIQKNLQSKLNESTKQLLTKFKQRLLDSNHIKPLLTSKYPHEPIILKYLQKFKIYHPESKSSSHQISINQLTYFIDNQGYVLDNDRFYLINEQTKERIKLDARHIECLKKNKILI